MAAYYLMIAYLACVYIQPGIKFPALAPFRPVLVVGLLAIVASVVYASRREKPMILRGQIMILLVFLVFMGLSVAGAYVQQDAFEAWVRFAKTVVLFFFMVNVVDTFPKLRGLLYGLLAIHALVAVEGILGFYTAVGRGDQQGLSGTLSNFLGDENDFALAINVVLPYALFLIPVVKTRRMKLFLAGCAGLFVLSLMFTFSRGGFVTLVAVGLHFLLKSKRKFLALGLAGVLALAAVVVMPATYWERIQSIGQYREDGSSQGRFWAWEAGWRMALDHPILGLGPGNFRTGYGKFYKPREAREAQFAPERWATAHSVYFQVLGELGFVGLGLFLWLVLSIFRTQRGLLRRYPPDSSADGEFVRAACLGMQGSLLAFLVGGLFLSATYYPHVWLTAVLTQMLASTALSTSPDAIGAVTDRGHRPTKKLSRRFQRGSFAQREF